MKPISSSNGNTTVKEPSTYIFCILALTFLVIFPAHQATGNSIISLNFYRQRALPDAILLKAIRDRQTNAIVTTRGGFVIAVVASVNNL